MISMQRVFSLRPIDRAVIVIIAVLLMVTGLYLVGPWYITVTDTGKSPLYKLLQDGTVLTAYGVLLILDGVALIYSVINNKTSILTNALLTGFLLRLYALIGVLVTQESWLPPSYLSLAATVFITGSYWVWIRVNERPIK